MARSTTEPAAHPSQQRTRASSALEPGSCPAALRKASALAPLRLGVVAFSVSADTEMGDYDEHPTIIFKSGQLPPPFADED